MSHCAEHGAAFIHNVLHAAHLECLKGIVLSFCINDHGVDKATCHVNELHSGNYFVFPFFSCQRSRKVLHLVDGLHATFQQPITVSVGCDRITQLPFDPVVFRRSEEHILRVRCAGTRKISVLEYQQPTFVYPELLPSVYRSDKVIFRLPEFVERDSVRSVGIQRLVIRRNLRTLKYDELINAPDCVPIQRFVQVSSIVNAHQDRGAPKEP